MSKKYREFWIHKNHAIAYEYAPDELEDASLYEKAIEHAALEELEAKLKIAVEELEVIADNNTGFPPHFIAESALKQINGDD
jgi:hypothetical protein